MEGFTSPTRVAVQVSNESLRIPPLRRLRHSTSNPTLSKLSSQLQLA